MGAPGKAAPVLSDCGRAHPRTQGNGDGGAGAWGQLGPPQKACATRGVCGQPLCAQRSVRARVNVHVCALCVPARLCSVCARVPTDGPKWRGSLPVPQFPQQHREGWMLCPLVITDTSPTVPYVPAMPCGQPWGTRGSLCCVGQAVLAPCRGSPGTSCCFAGGWLNEASVDVVSH